MGKGFVLSIILNVYPPDPKLIAALSLQKEDEYVVVNPNIDKSDINF
jgi:predicted glycosyltransferase